MLAEQQAAEAARQAAEIAEDEGDWNSSGPVGFFDPNRPPSPPRKVSTEELCLLVPSLCTLLEPGSD